MVKAILVCLMSWLLTSICGPAVCRPADGTVPFELFGHLVLVEGRINGSTESYRFLVDTGGRTFLDRKVADGLELKQRGPMAKINSLDLTGFRIENIFCMTIFDFGPIRRTYGIELHGIIGSDLMERFTMTFDCGKRELTFSEDTTRTPIPAEAAALHFRNHPVNNAPIVELGAGGDRTIEGMIDTGQPFSLTLPIGDLEEYEGLLGDMTIESQGPIMKWPMTSSDENVLARMKRLSLDGLACEDPVILFAELPRPLSMPLVGMDLLSLFVMTIDYPRDEIILRPADGASCVTDRYTFGLSPVEDEGGAIVVRGLWDGSPADGAGIKPGDVITRFDSTPATGATLAALRALLLDDGVTEMELEIAREGGARTLTLVKARLFSP